MINFGHTSSMLPCKVCSCCLGASFSLDLFLGRHDICPKILHSQFVLVVVMVYLPLFSFEFLFVLFVVFCQHFVFMGRPLTDSGKQKRTRVSSINLALSSFLARNCQKTRGKHKMHKYNFTIITHTNTQCAKLLNRYLPFFLFCKELLENIRAKKAFINRPFLRLSF